MSSSVQGLPGHQLSYKAQEWVCHAIEDYVHRLREESGLLRMHCYRATLKTVISPGDKESTSTTLYRVCPSGSAPRWPAPGHLQSGGHAEAGESCGGILQPGSATGTGGVDSGAAGQDAIPSRERYKESAGATL